MHLLGELARAVGGERAGQEGADLGRLGVELRAKRSGVLAIPRQRRLEIVMAQLSTSSRMQASAG
jgi:hypothetical protein